MRALYRDAVAEAQGRFGAAHDEAQGRWDAAHDDYSDYVERAKTYLTNVLMKVMWFVAIGEWICAHR